MALLNLKDIKDVIAVYYDGEVADNVITTFKTMFDTLYIADKFSNQSYYIQALGLYILIKKLKIDKLKNLSASAGRVIKQQSIAGKSITYGDEDTSWLNFLTDELNGILAKAYNDKVSAIRDVVNYN